MNDFLRTIAIIAVMAGISSTAYRKEVDTNDAGHVFDDLIATGKKLGRKFHDAKKSSDENLLASFYEEFGNVISSVKDKEQIDTISKSFSEEVLEFQDQQTDAMPFVEMRMLALLSDDPTAVNDVDAAFYIAAEKHRSKFGDDATQNFIKVYEYSNAGAFLGHELASARMSNNIQIADMIENRVADFKQKLSETEELHTAFNKAFTRFSAMA